MDQFRHQVCLDLRENVWIVGDSGGEQNGLRMGGKCEQFHGKANFAQVVRQKVLARRIQRTVDDVSNRIPELVDNGQSTRP